MKKILLAAILGLGALGAQAGVEHLLPRVQQLEHLPLGTFELKGFVSVNDPTDCAVLKEFVAEHNFIVTKDAYDLIQVSLVDKIDGAFNHNLPDFPDEAYKLWIDGNHIFIEALTPTGVLRAAQTLRQLAIGQTELESMKIVDWPAFKLRGVMHDVGRSFVSVDELKKELRLLSAYKVNTFHWHLTENQAWRFEVKAYPQLTQSQYATRFAGQYYTQDQIREVLAVAKQYGITVIPEIDMPGHSGCFERAMGFEMQTAQGKEVLKTVLEEVADVFADSPYLHIGADEKTITDNTFLDTMIDKIHSLGKKVVCWNRINGVNIADHAFDMTQMWATSGTKVAGIPNIDCRYNYVNHFDVYADLVGIYKSSIYYEQRGTNEVAGTITALWNDRKTPTEVDIIKQNNMYANVLASAERAWIGGGKQYIEKGGTMLPNAGEEFEEFADWERRFLLHKAGWLKDEPIPYVKQTNVRWNVTEGFSNGGNADTSFAPEQGLDNPTWTATPVTGAGIYLRHTWGGTVPGLYGAAATGQTAYAYTYVYSPVAQTVGAQIEFQNYGRSEKDTAPDAGKWDRKGSRLWVNDEEILPDAWTNTGKSIDNEVDLGNENFTARPVKQIQLKEGWNKVLIKLPYVAASGVRLNKWMWTFVLTDLDGKNAVDGLIYSPAKSMDADSDLLASLIQECRSAVNSKIKDEVGYYPSTHFDVDLLAKCDELEATLGENHTADERAAQRAELTALLQAFNAACAANGINLPKAGHFYYLQTPLRGNYYASASGSSMIGRTTASTLSAWTFQPRTDGTFDIVNYKNAKYVSPEAAYNTQLKVVADQPAAGWEVKPADETGYVIITSGENNSVQFNQTNINAAVYNWGNGNLSDTGCKYKFIATEYTGINEIQAEQLGTNACYDLQGRRVVTPTHGIYILNGQKVIL